MTNKEIFIEIFGIDKGNTRFAGCDGIICPADVTCITCSYHNFWEEEADLGKIYANISVMGLGKALLNSMYGKSVTYKDTDSFPMNKPIEKKWVQVPTQILNEDCQNIMEVIDDATTNGLNFKYEDGKWYFAEG